MTLLERKLRGVRLRMAANRLLSTALSSLAIAWACAAVAILADRLFCPSYPLGWTPWAATAAGAAAALLLALARRPSMGEAAVWTDARMGLAERLSSALMVAGGTPMEAAVRADADRHAARLSPGAACPLGVPRRRWAGAALSLVVLGSVLLLPPYDLLGRRKARDAREKELLAVQAQARLLEQKVRKLSEEAKERGIEALEVGKGLEQLAADLKDGIHDPKAALAEVNDLQARMKAEMEQFKDKAQTARDVERAVQAVEKALAGQQASSLKDLAQQMEELAKKAAAGQATDQEVREMQKQLSALAEALEKGAATQELASELSRASEALSDKGNEAMAQMADNLKNLAGKLGDMEKTIGREEMMEMAKADLAEMRQQLGGQAQDPWQAEVSEADRREFEEKMAELEKNGLPDTGGG